MKDTFDEKLDVGLAGEKITFDYLTRVLGRDVKQSQGFDRAKDLLVAGIPVEVKMDLMAFKTGQVCIEHRSLETHTAPYVLYMVPHFYWADRNTLKELVAWYPNQKNGGDDGRKQTFLEFDSPTFPKVFKPVKT